MNDSECQEDIIAANEESLLQLKRSLILSQGDFSIILAYCPSKRLRKQIAQQLHESLAIAIQELTLPPSAQTLYTTIYNALPEPHPEALMVFGLESVVNIEELLVATNFVRDEFRKQFSFPLVLWVNQEILQKMIRLAPDFKNWTTTAIRFERVCHKVVDFPHRPSTSTTRRKKAKHSLPPIQHRYDGDRPISL